MTTTDLTTQTPAEIDTALAAIYDHEWETKMTLMQVRSDIERAEIRYAKSGNSWDAPSEYLTAHEAALQAEIEQCWADARPLNAEFTRRGGWTRAWLVDNSNGHVHRSMQCNTCFETTRFGWLPQVSGMVEHEIVALAGEKACTVCYPSAPAAVLNNACALELPARKAERLVREAEKAARTASKIEKGITPDGSVLKLQWVSDEFAWVKDAEGNSVRGTAPRRHWKELKTARAAEIFVVAGLAGTEYDNPTPEVLEQVLDLLVAKGYDRATLQAKADKKRKAELR